MIRCENLHNDTHRPAVPGSDVWAASGVDDRTVGVVRVRVAENEGSCIDVCLVTVGLEAEVGNTQEGGNIGVVLERC